MIKDEYILKIRIMAKLTLTMEETIDRQIFLTDEDVGEVDRHRVE